MATKKDWLKPRSISDQRILAEAEILARDGLQRLQQSVEKLHRVHESWMKDYADSLSRIAIAAAERVVMDRLDQERELLVRWAEEALTQHSQPPAD